MIPTEMAKALARTDTSKLPGKLTIEVECQGSRFHSPRPLLVEQVEVGGRSVWLCPNCASIVAVYVHLVEHADGKLPWKLAREFGTQIRMLAEGRRVEPPSMA